MTDTQDTPEPEDEVSTLATNFGQVAQSLFSAGSVDDTLAQVVGLAVATIEGCDVADIFLADSDGTRTLVSTDRADGRTATLQISAGEGPCFDAVAQGVTVYADDLINDTRWPRFGPEATAGGMRSLLALPLFVGPTLGALNLYGRYPQAFGVIDRARGLLLAGLAALSLASAQTHEDEERRIADLHVALATREVIGQAQGILMEREHVTPDQAFDILRHASQHLNVKLEVAQTLVDTGERPDTGSAPEP